jgi:hypothetical protein
VVTIEAATTDCVFQYRARYRDSAPHRAARRGGGHQDPGQAGRVVIQGDITRGQFEGYLYRFRTAVKSRNGMSKYRNVTVRVVDSGGNEIGSAPPIAEWLAPTPVERGPIRFDVEVPEDRMAVSLARSPCCVPSAGAWTCGLSQSSGGVHDT